ncbi:uncharacterized protein YraI [Kibdelosporangium banguiense]|uniref:Uncharacterized protein YraI n=1 Tax=Kibdelosporangium banguiense TaxID=1365924 RepID=A0ABS4TKI0_9PSEU|nr:SH3 domain-containing protein [Kibdelosporangium banguiense]MBP2324489.1 uncharacterized protein YraI [Kibdelosporangium banguiense]
MRPTPKRLGAVLIAVVGLILAGAAPAFAATGTISTAGDPVNVRRAPTTSSTIVGSAANGRAVTIDCQTTGISVTGHLGTTSRWDYIPALGGYVSHAYVQGQAAPECGVGTGSAECSTGICAGEGQFKSSNGHFLVYDRDADGKSAVVAYWLKGGVGPLYAWNSNGNGTSTDRATNVPSGDWVYYKVCIADYSTTPTLEACSNGITDYVA